MIYSSFATVGSISGADNVGGLVGDGGSATISSSFAVTKSINGTSNVGSLFGRVGPAHALGTATASYWDDSVTLMPATGNTAGSSQTTAALQNPVANSDGSFPAGIYSEWDNGYCNPNTGEYRETAPNPLGDYIRVWDLGTASQYPAITCAQSLFSLAEQRAATARVVAGESPIQ